MNILRNKPQNIILEMNFLFDEEIECDCDKSLSYLGK